MGNQSGSDYGGTYIRTDKPFYFAGEIVTGIIFVYIKEIFTSILLDLDFQET